MGDFSSGRYPDYNPEWLLDGSPASPNRASISRTAITGAAVTGAATTVPYVTAVPVMPGDVFGYVSFTIDTLAGTPGAGSFVVVYAGMPTASNNVAVLGVSATFTAVAGANKIALTGLVNVGAVPTVYGVAICEAWTTTGSQFEGVPGGTTAFKGQLTGQLVLATKLPAAGAPPVVGSLSGTTITAPASGYLPYVVLSRT